MEQYECSNPPCGWVGSDIKYLKCDPTWPGQLPACPRCRKGAILIYESLPAEDRAKIEADYEAWRREVASMSPAQQIETFGTVLE
ncbi:MAG: hypothetical protein M3361_19950 [Candidatus Tectomicrobia bacterium]|nr:hypothetical protein [Candidatus Tectomicrobia bacterium]